MTDQSQPAAGATPPPPKSFAQRVGTWIGIIAGIVIAGVSIIRLVSNYTVLPSCDSTRMTDTLRRIYRDQKVEIKAFSDIKTVSTSNTENTCTAVADVGDERVPVYFRTFWEGWTAQVSARFGLVSCDSPRTADSIQNIFKKRDINFTSMSKFQTVSTSETENICTAHVDAPTEQATITFRVYRKEGETFFLVTDVKTQPK